MIMADADDNMGVEAVSPNSENHEENSEEQQGDDDVDESISAEEYDVLDAKLDDLNIVLDMIEQKNDQIRDEFLKLLHSNKQIREELQQENNKQDNGIKEETTEDKSPQ